MNASRLERSAIMKVLNVHVMSIQVYSFFYVFCIKLLKIIITLHPDKFLLYETNSISAKRVKIKSLYPKLFKQLPIRADFSSMLRLKRKSLLSGPR